MSNEPKKRGRPRKTKDRIPFSSFVRMGWARIPYDEARKSGEKHSVALREAVQAVKERAPQMPMSETGAKRIVATTCPRNTPTAITFERETASPEKLARILDIRRKLAAMEGKPLSGVPTLSKISVVKFGFTQRPNYPRHNAKPPKK